MSDILDLRNLAEELREAIAEDIDPEDRDTDLISALVNLAQEVANYSGDDPSGAADALEEHGDGYEPTLIADSYFTEYARDLAEEIGAIDPNASWPLNHIDWDAAAEALQQDYVSVEYDGETYWIRSV